jgi:hypothetical protein
MARAIDNLTTPTHRRFFVCSSNGIQAQTARRPADDAGQYARARRAEVDCVMPERCLPSFRPCMKCVKCGGRNVDMRPNWKEQPVQPSLTGKQWR